AVGLSVGGAGIVMALIAMAVPRTVSAVVAIPVFGACLLLSVKYGRLLLGWVQSLDNLISGTKRGATNRRAATLIVLVTFGVGMVGDQDANLKSGAGLRAGHATSAPPGSLLVTPDQLKAQLQLANVTRGDAIYSPSVSASYDEVVKAELYYANCSYRSV